MNRNTLIGLAVAAVVAIGAAALVRRSDAPSVDHSQASGFLVPDLREHLNDVTRIVVTGAEGRTLATLERGADGWSLLEKSGYPADTGKLRGFLLKLADARRLEQKTSNRDKYAVLGVEDVAAKDAKGVQVELAGLARPVKLVIGASDPRGGTYVRLVDDAPSWLVSGTLSIDKGGSDWLRKDLVDIPATRVASVSIERADGGSVRISKANATDANFTLSDVPKGREPGSEYAINGLASTLASLHFDDVVASKDAPAADKPVKARYATFDGVVVGVTAWAHDGKDYAQFTASLDDAAADAGIVVAQAKAKAEYEAAHPATAGADASASADAPAKPLALTDASKDREQRLEALKKDVAAMQSRFEGWTYVVPAYKYANIDKPLADLLKAPGEAAAGKPAKPARPAKSP